MSVFAPASAVLAGGDFAEEVSFGACAPADEVAGLFCCGAATAPASTGCTRIGTQRFCSTIAIAAERSLAVTTPSTSVPWALRALYRNSGMSPECCVSGNHKGKPAGLPVHELIFETAYTHLRFRRPAIIMAATAPIAMTEGSGTATTANLSA